MKITTLFGNSVPPASPNDHENTFEESMAIASCLHLSGIRLGVVVQSVFVLVKRKRPRSTGGSVKITTLFGNSVAPASPNDHENTFDVSMAFASCPHLSGIRLGAGVQSVFVLVDSAKDRDRRAVL